MSFANTVSTPSIAHLPQAFGADGPSGAMFGRLTAEVARLAGQDPGGAARLVRDNLSSPLSGCQADTDLAGAVLARLSDDVLKRLTQSPSGRELLDVLDRPSRGGDVGHSQFDRLRDAFRSAASDAAGTKGDLAGHLPRPAHPDVERAVGNRSAGAPSTEQVKGAFEKEFAAKAHDKPEFDRFMRQVFGDNLDAGKAERYRQQALAGDFSFLPEVKFVDAGTLQGANGAYDADKGVVYINRELAAADPATAAQTFVEEAGHHLDAQLNTVDTRGDEGEMFRRLLAGEQLSDTQMAQIRNDDDRGTIVVDGKEVAVEFWNPFKAVADGVKAVGGAIADGAKAVGGAIADGAKAVGGVIADGAKAVGSAAADVADGVWNGVKNVGSGIAGAAVNVGKGLFQATAGFVSNLFDGNLGEALQSVTRGIDRALFQSTARLASGVLDGFKSVADGVTDALGPIGKPLRWVTDRVFDIGHTALDTGFGIVRDVVRLAPELVTGFVGDIERAVKLAADGRWGDAAGQLGMAFVNIPGRIGGTAMDVGLRALQGVASAGQTAIGLEPPARGLNQQEREYLESIYGDSIDYDVIRVKQGGPLNNAMAPHTVGNTIYMPEKFNIAGGGKGDNFNADGTLTPQGLETLGHEAGHVWQNQNGGGDYIHNTLSSQLLAMLRSGDRDDAYDWREALGDDQTFETMNDEQRAKAMEDIGSALSGDGVITASDGGTGTNYTPEELAFLQDVWDKVRRGEGAG